MKKIKVLNLEYEIIELSLVDNDIDLLGQINHREQIIRIRNDISEERKKVVLLHEVLHAIFQQTGFNEEHNDEHLIESLSIALYQVFKDNEL